MNIEFRPDIRLDRDAWLRLLGVSEAHRKASETDEKMRAALTRLAGQMEEAEDLLKKTARPCFLYCLADREELAIRGESLQKHLEGCGRLMVMAVTLGEEVDQLIADTQRDQIALAVVIDCGASVMAQLAADTAEKQIREELSAAQDEGAPLFMTARFSPGYGDSPLEMQTELLALLDAEEEIGIRLSKGFMMSPSKSITAIAGLSDHPVTGRLATCDECVLKDKCQLKKEGKRCSTSPDQ